MWVIRNPDVSGSYSLKAFSNVFAESFMKTLKYDEVYVSDYRTFDEAFDNPNNFIRSVYNKKRLHSKIVYLPIMEFEE